MTVALEGYEPQTHEIRNPWSATGTTTGMVGNAIIGGGIGVGIDAMTGANRDLTPNPLVVSLVPISAATAAVEQEAAAALPLPIAAAPEQTSVVGSPAP